MCQSQGGLIITKGQALPQRWTGGHFECFMNLIREERREQEKILLCYSLLVAHVPLWENYSITGCINACYNEHVTLSKGLVALFNLMIFRER